ncbi:MAG: hypothetical protein KDD27_27870 [Saprospiraceae bacterium]|nr:hypothetical protein [Saprospiraceae bacterium]
MVAANIKARKQPRDTHPENVYVVSSKDTQVPEGKVYAVIKGKDKLFIINNSGKKVLLDDSQFSWEERDKDVMIVQATSSRLESIKPGLVYRVYLDAENDELYVIDENNERVLFDKNIFKWEVI